MTLRLVFALGLALAIAGCGTKSELVTPYCSKAERAESAGAAPPGRPPPCGKLAKKMRDPSEPPNPIER